MRQNVQVASDALGRNQPTGVQFGHDASQPELFLELGQTVDQPCSRTDAVQPPRFGRVYQLEAFVKRDCLAISVSSTLR